MPSRTRSFTVSIASLAAVMSIALATPNATAAPDQDPGAPSTSVQTTAPVTDPPPTSAQTETPTVESTAPSSSAPTTEQAPSSTESAPTTTSEAPSAATPAPTTAAPSTKKPQARAAAVAAGCQTYPPTSYQVCGVIRDKYNQMNGPNSFLLYPKSNELTNPGNTGKRSEFLGGNIYWSSATGAHPVAHDFLTKWGEKGYEGGYLKYPTSDEIPLSTGLNGRRQEYQGGFIYFSQPTGAHTVQGTIKDYYLANGAQGGPLGYATSDETVTPDGKGRFNTFEHGAVYWSPTTGAHAILNRIYSAWSQSGYETGPYGYPTEDFKTDSSRPGAVSQKFQNGTVMIYGWSEPVDGNGCTPDDVMGCAPTGEYVLDECREFYLESDAIIILYHDSQATKLKCRDYRTHIIPEHFQEDGVSVQNEHDFLVCTANAIVFGQDWDGSRTGIGRQTSNTSGTHGYVAINKDRTINTAFTSGDGKDWGGCARDSNPQ